MDEDEFHGDGVRMGLMSNTMSHFTINNERHLHLSRCFHGLRHSAMHKGFIFAHVNENTKHVKFRFSVFQHLAGPGFWLSDSIDTNTLRI